MDHEFDLVEMERLGWAALSSGPEQAKKFYASTLTDDAQFLFPGGLRLAGKERILETMGGPPWQSFRITDARVTTVSGTVCAVIYDVAARRDGGDPYSALACSTYVQRSGTWQLAIHQQTPV